MLEEGEPELVIMSFREYERLNQGRGLPLSRIQEDRPRYHPEFADLEPRGVKETEFIHPVVAGSPGLPVRLEDIHLEDLPI